MLLSQPDSIPAPSPHPLFLGVCVWVPFLFFTPHVGGFSPSAVDKTLRSPVPELCCSLSSSRAIAALGGWACASGFENEASCHYQTRGAKSLAEHGFVRGKNSYAVFSELWEEKWL